MSIINDALKKTQNNIIDNKKNPTSPAQGKTRSLQPEQKSTNPIPRKEKQRSFMIGIFILLAFVVLLLLIPLVARDLYPDSSLTRFLSFGSFFKSGKPTASSSSTMSSSTSADEQLPVVAQELKLNGIMIMGDKRAALINDDVYYTGEKIKGMTITAINAKTVDLKNGEQTITLDVRDAK